MPPRKAKEKDNGPLPIHTPTIQLGFSQPIGFAIQPRLFFRSEQWITPLYRDINALLNSFEYEWTQELERQKKGNDGDNVDEIRRSPFQVFKELWKEKGWSLIHLLGVTDGPLRTPWGESVLRGFAEHLSPSEPALRQIGALFAIFIFVKTQPSTMVQQYLQIDIPTLEYLFSFPSSVGPSLDPTNSSPLSPPPSTDVTTVITSLLSPSKPLFYLIPTELYLHPKNLPTVLIRDARERQGMELVGKRLLGVEEELEWLRNGKGESLEKVREKVKRKLQRAHEEDLVGDSEEEEEDAEEEAMETARTRGSAGGTGILESWIGQLSKTSRDYAAVKGKKKRASLTGHGITTSVLLRPRSKLQLEVMNKAEEATMYKVRETGLEPTVERRNGGRREARPDRGETKHRLFDLVKGIDEVRKDSNKKRRRLLKKDGKSSQPMRELETALTLLDKSSVYE